MALRRCAECDAKVSEYANSCPKCGCPFEGSGGEYLFGSLIADRVLGCVFWLIVIGAIVAALV